MTKKITELKAVTGSDLGSGQWVQAYQSSMRNLMPRSPVTGAPAAIPPLTEMPGPLPCAHCAKAPLADPPDEDGVVYVRCMTVGCVTYGDPRWKIRLDLWNTRAGEQMTEASRLALKRLAEIGSDFLSHLNIEIEDSAEIYDAINTAGQLYHAERKRRQMNQYQQHASMGVDYARQAGKGAYAEAQALQQQYDEELAKQANNHTKGSWWKKAHDAMSATFYDPASEPEDQAP